MTAAGRFSLTAEHRAQWPAWHDRWVALSRRTTPQAEADRRAMIDAVNGLYDAADLARPKNIVFVPSPLVGWVVSGISAAIWFASDQTTDSPGDLYRDVEVATSPEVVTATANATWQKTWDAVWQATLVGSDAFSSGDPHWDATWLGPWDGVWQATYDAVRETRANDVGLTAVAVARTAIDDATRGSDVVWRDHADDAGRTSWVAALSACLPSIDTNFLTRCVHGADAMMTGGNLWPAPVEFISFFRHVVRLPIDFSAWRHYEAAAMHGGFRFMHREFCVVVDFPEQMVFDGSNRPHCAVGPSHRWRDGFEVHHRHGRHPTSAPGATQPER